MPVLRHGLKIYLIGKIHIYGTKRHNSKTQYLNYVENQLLLCLMHSFMWRLIENENAGML
jgi:hypothetical protein